ncbi:hypothetical protein HKBW3S03_01561, partial [Candidatus Hakubella thermalkaliphila]
IEVARNCSVEVETQPMNPMLLTLN